MECKNQLWSNRALDWHLWNLRSGTCWAVWLWKSQFTTLGFHFLRCGRSGFTAADHTILAWNYVLWIISIRMALMSHGDFEEKSNPEIHLGYYSSTRSQWCDFDISQSLEELTSVLFFSSKVWEGKGKNNDEEEKDFFKGIFDTV